MCLLCADLFFLSQSSTLHTNYFSPDFFLLSLEQCEREGFFQKIHEEKGEGCNINGFLEVNKVVGTFHFIPGKTFHMTEFSFDDLFAVQKDNYNVSSDISIFLKFFIYLLFFL